MNEARSPATVIGSDAAAALMGPLTDLVVRAGAAILAVDRAAMRIGGKRDGSPVTEADLAADRIIAEGLARLAPDIPALSEERVDAAKTPYEGSFFLIDPLDGTKEFVAGRSEFTVNVALVTNGTPLLGIIGAPALGLVWRGLVGRGAERLKSGEGALPALRYAEVSQAGMVESVASSMETSIISPVPVFCCRYKAELMANAAAMDAIVSHTT